MGQSCAQNVFGDVNESWGRGMLLPIVESFNLLPATCRDGNEKSFEEPKVSLLRPSGPMGTLRVPGQRDWSGYRQKRGALRAGRLWCCHHDGLRCISVGCIPEGECMTPLTGSQHPSMEAPSDAMSPSYWAVPDSPIFPVPPAGIWDLGDAEGASWGGGAYVPLAPRVWPIHRAGGQDRADPVLLLHASPGSL